MTSTYASDEKTRVPDAGTNQASIDLEQARPKAGLKSRQYSSCIRFNPIVQITPAESVKRLGTGGHRWFTETIYAPIGNKIEFRFQGSVHLLALYNEGARRNGETCIEGLASSKVRNFVNKLTFVPAGHAYREWHETGASTRVTFLYLDPAKLQKSDDEDTPYVPRIYFEDSTVWETAAKLKRAIERGQENTPYLEALSSVLAHELSRSLGDIVRDAPVSRGGLASWQKRTVVGYIEEHLCEQIRLLTLARLARLSQHHFCRAFKQSFGVPPHQYHVQQRMERAKILLADRTASVTDIGLTLGYSQTSSFSAAFRKTTGWAPSEYRRAFK
ncbi:helix-turn-helix domain-containing protein [Bradyrhizobium sp. LeoA1S1]